MLNHAQFCRFSNRTDVKSGVSALNNTSTSFGSAAAHNVDPADDALRMQALLEEEAAMNHYKVCSWDYFIYVLERRLDCLSYGFQVTSVAVSCHNEICN